MAKPQFLSGDKNAIDEFLNRFDVCFQNVMLLNLMLTRCSRSSCSTAMVCADLLPTRHVDCTGVPNNARHLAIY
jgi:hypothetical protein